MFELFGFVPLLKIVLLFFVFTYLSFLVGTAISGQTTTNKAIQLFVGISAVLAIMAIVNTKGLSVFTPSLLCILILFKPRFTAKSFNYFDALNNTASFSCFVLPFFGFELIRQFYFSDEYINSGFGDYQFYADAAQNIWNGGVESSLAYLSHYDLSTATNIYHYYDLYLLVPLFLMNIPPLIGYFFFLLPLTYAIGAFSLFHMTSSKKNVGLLFLLSFLAIHLPGVEFPKFETFQRLTILHYPKACFMLLPILLLRLRPQWSLVKILVAATFLSLMLNPLIFVLMAATSVVVFFIYKRKENITISSVFKLEYLLIYFGFAAYFIFVFTSKSDNSVLYTFMEDQSFDEYLKGAVARFIGYSGVIKKLPIVVFSVLILAYQYYQNRELKIELVFVTVTFGIGHITCSLMFNHYEAMQFFNISFVTLIGMYFFFAIKDIRFVGNKVERISSGLLLIVLMFTYLTGGYSIYTQPRSIFQTTVAFNVELHEAVSKEKHVNALFFKNYTEETHWIRTIPYLTYGLGYMNLIQNSNCLIPTDPAMFEGSNTVKANALNLISRGPFSIYCQENNFKPKSFYDSDFEMAIKGFMKEYNINVLVFEKEMEAPNWLKELQESTVIEPKAAINKHRIYVL